MDYSKLVIVFLSIGIVLLVINQLLGWWGTRRWDRSEARMAAWRKRQDIKWKAIALIDKDGGGPQRRVWYLPTPEKRDMIRRIDQGRLD